MATCPSESGRIDLEIVIPLDLAKWATDHSADSGPLEKEKVMSKLIGFRYSAIVMTAVTLVAAAEISASDLLDGDQDGVQDTDRMCDLTQDCNRVVDPQIEPDPDEPVKKNKVVDSRFKPDREPDSDRLIDPGIEPVEGPEENPVIDPPENFDPGSTRNQNRLNDSGIDGRSRVTESRSAKP